MTLAGMEATLRLYLDEEKATQTLPTLRMISMTVPELEKKAAKLLEQMKKTGTAKLFDIDIEKSMSEVGGGALPGQELETRVLSLKPKAMSVDSLERYFRAGDCT